MNSRDLGGRSGRLAGSEARYLRERTSLDLNMKGSSKLNANGFVFNCVKSG
ncbi:hypothetical protein Patl1_12549 [Pistacia atlantica]|uniref:Uncharacterized protein n=1 Tax=Pistacia atlantica TaxID=434234 RepID=A0ACC1AX07_9ROSI|nr:hypothetical protein Patl1_12549 [Pistacia atlantica]